MSRLFAGNVITQILGDFGAEMIKVESPAGDTLRAWQTEGVSTHWKVYARNKKSLCLDLHKSRARELLLELAATRTCSSRVSARVSSRTWGWVRTSCLLAIRV